MDTATSINMHNIVTTDVIHDIVVRKVKALLNDPSRCDRTSPIMLRGAPGVGKSAIVRGIAAELNIGFIDMRLAQMERVDVCGVPSVVDGKTKWNVPDMMPADKDSAGILFFDELTSSPSDVQVAAYSLVLDRRIPNSDYKLPDRWFIIAAGNRAEDGAVVKTLSSALANRFSHYELDCDVENWCIWAQSHDIDPSIIGFIHYRPNCLFKMEKANREFGWPSPRSWEKLSTEIEDMGDNEQLLRYAVNANIGCAVGCEFMSFYKLNSTFDDVLEMMVNPKAKVNIPTQADRRYAMASAVNYLLWRGSDDTDTKARIAGFYRICDAMPNDFCAMMVKQAMAGNSKISRVEASLKLMSDKTNYMKTAKKFAEANKDAAITPKL